MSLGLFVPSIHSYDGEMEGVEEAPARIDMSEVE
jgi:hypothetical protein